MAAVISQRQNGYIRVTDWSDVTRGNEMWRRRFLVKMRVVN